MSGQGRQDRRLDAQCTATYASCLQLCVEFSPQLPTLQAAHSLKSSCRSLLPTRLVPQQAAGFGKPMLLWRGRRQGAGAATAAAAQRGSRSQETDRRPGAIDRLLKRSHAAELSGALCKAAAQLLDALSPGSASGSSAELPASLILRKDAAHNRQRTPLDGAATPRRQPRHARAGQRRPAG